MDNDVERRFRLFYEAINGLNEEQKTFVTKDEFSEEIKKIKIALNFLLRANPTTLKF